MTWEATDSVEPLVDCGCERERVEVRNAEGGLCQTYTVPCPHDQPQVVDARPPGVLRVPRYLSDAQVKRLVASWGHLDPPPLPGEPTLNLIEPDIPATDWPRFLHPLAKWFLPRRAFARWCEWRYERLRPDVRDPLPFPKPWSDRPNTVKQERH